MELEGTFYVIKVSPLILQIPSHVIHFINLMSFMFKAVRKNVEDIFVLMVRIFLIPSLNLLVHSSYLCLFIYFVNTDLWHQNSLEQHVLRLQLQYFYIGLKKHPVPLLTLSIPKGKTKQNLVSSFVFLFNLSVLFFTNSSLNNSFLKTVNEHDEHGFRECLLQLFNFSCLTYLKVISGSLAAIPL